MIPQRRLITTALRDWLELEDLRHYYPGIDPWKCSYLKCVQLWLHARKRDNPQNQQVIDAEEALRDLEDQLWAGGGA